MSKTHRLTVAISAAVMLGALIFGLIPDGGPTQVTTVAMASSKVVR